MVNPLLLKVAPWAFAALALGGFKWHYDRSQRELGAMRERLRVTDSSLVIAIEQGRRVDSVFVRDTVRLTRTIARTETLIDTLLRSDTVTLTKRESVLVFVADSLVKQCRATVTSCTTLVGNLREQLRLTGTQRDAYRKLVPSGFDRATSTIRDIGIGVGLKILYDALIKR